LLKNWWPPWGRWGLGMSYRSRLVDSADWAETGAGAAALAGLASHNHTQTRVAGKLLARFV
jgi:uncharacterized protein (DUF1800 family)